MSSSKIIFWFRQDLRLSDNPGLMEAAKQGTVIPIYILDDETPGEERLGGASRWWLHHSLVSLNKSLGGALRVYKGKPQEIFETLIQQFSPAGVYWNRCYEPWRIQQDTRLKQMLKDQGLQCQSFNASLLWEPWDVLKSDKTPYRVFTPYYRRGCLEAPQPRRPLPILQTLKCLQQDTSSEIDHLELLPEIRWYQEMAETWTVGEEGAFKRLAVFLDENIRGYKEFRNFPSRPNVSRLSPHLHFGEISPNQVWYAAQSHSLSKGLESDLDCFLSELGWREFSYYLLYHFPQLVTENFQPKFNAYPWQENPQALIAWQKGQTGYPIVDAGMRELWQTGYMHNRVRMIVGSFLVKNLGIHWREGARWFWDCLVDADLASNSASWQWVAGTGADAAPYFRIFNPILQSQKFDPEGLYIRQYVPELSKLPSRYLCQPWTASPSILREAGIILGKTYPLPLIEWDESRKRALQGYKDLSSVENSH